MNVKPLISVVITTCNRKELLWRAIKSVIEQDYSNVEIVISDDCSSYNLKEALKEFDTPIVYRRNEVNRGACYTRNEGIKLAKGTFIAGLDDDDEFEPDRLSYLLNNYDDKYSLITSNTLVVGSSSSRALFNENTTRIVTFEDLLWENVIGTQVLVKKDKILDCGGFDISLTSGQDADMWLGLLNKYGPALRLPKCKYKLHTEHESNRISTSKKKIDGWLAVNAKYARYKTVAQLRYSNLKMNCFNKKYLLLWKLITCFDSGIYKYVFRRVMKFV
jgi:glycosyltransferase involved in cell wall biosynthesis